MITNSQIEAARVALRKYVADDGLKPEWNGQSAWAVAEAILKAAEAVEFDEMAQSYEEEEIKV